MLPPTVPGAAPHEGIFMLTAADDGGRAIYFVAHNTRHSISAADFEQEQQVNPLWPVRTVSREEALSLTEAAPIGGARTSLIGAPVVVEPSTDVLAEAPTHAEAAHDFVVASTARTEGADEALSLP
jgi:hypothetical protein